MDVLLESSKIDDLYLEIHVENNQKCRLSMPSDQLYTAKLLKLQNTQNKLILWDDPIGKPILTTKQLKKLSQWVRISQLSNNPTLICNKISYERIQQGYVGNCSLLSSLNSMANYDLLYNNNVISKIFIPNHSFIADSNNNSINSFARQIINNTGFSCRIFINGTSRIVKVDDWVPIRSDGRLLCAHSTLANELWITILEKVFIKLLGNTYNLSGTNPCLDLYRFTNFIPEIIKIDSCNLYISNNSTEDYPNDPIWEYLYQRFKSGLSMSCLGTLEFDNVEVTDQHELVNGANGVSPVSGIVSNHAYSVIDLQEVDGYKLLFLKNPWGKISWRQKFSDGDVSETALKVFKKLGYSPKSTDNGTFWIQWSDVVKWFSYLYISHNPSQFKCERTLHLRWNSYPHFCESLLNDFYHMGFNPQLKISFTEKIDNMWILVIQHRKSSKEELKYIATHLFFRDVKVKLSASPDIQGTYYNAECALNKFDNLKSTFHLLTTLLDSPTKGPFNITFRIFSNENFNVEVVEPPIDDFAKHLSITSNWDGSSHGVNDIDTYFLNPSVKFTLYQYSKVLVLLESEEAFHVNLRVFEGINHLESLLKQGKTLNSGLCRLHICSIEDEFPTGIYAIIPSTYNGGIGRFRIVVYIRPIEQSNSDETELGQLELMNYM